MSREFEKESFLEQKKRIYFESLNKMLSIESKQIFLISRFTFEKTDEISEENAIGKTSIVKETVLRSLGEQRTIFRAKRNDE